MDAQANSAGLKACLRITGILVFLALGFGCCRATASLGTAQFTAQTSCPAGTLTPSGTTCYKVTIQSCAGGNPKFVAWLRVTKPAVAAKGTILFTVGEGGTGWYDQDFVFGSTITNAVVQAGYAAAQVYFSDFSRSSPISEPSGWLTVLNGTNDGPGELACRYATLVSGFSTSSIYPGGHLGATGNSAGGALIAYALAQYGLGPTLTLAEITSAPPLARVDNGCLCNQGPTLTTSGQGFLSQCFFGEAQAVVDPTYAATAGACSGAVSSHVEPSGVNFQAASILSGSEVTSYPQTTINILFGGQDQTAGVANSINWSNTGVISAKKLTITTIPDAPHSLPDSFAGAVQIIADLTSF